MSHMPEVLHSPKFNVGGGHTGSSGGRSNGSGQCHRPWRCRPWWRPGTVFHSCGHASAAGQRGERFPAWQSHLCRPASSGAFLCTHSCMLQDDTRALLQCSRFCSCQCCRHQGPCMQAGVGIARTVNISKCACVWLCTLNMVCHPCCGLVYRTVIAWHCCMNVHTSSPHLCCDLLVSLALVVW